MRLTGRTGRVWLVLATLVYVAGIGVAMAPPGQAIGGSCNGHLASSPDLDASHERGPVILEGTDGNDVIIGSRGDDIIHGNGGDDIICGGAGADDITAGEICPATATACTPGTPGNATVFGESGDDTIRVGDGKNFVSGGPGNDDISVGTGQNFVHGGPGNDIINASKTGPGSKINGDSGYNLCYVNPDAEVDNCRFR
jgi:hypothetical protein